MGGGQQIALTPPGILAPALQFAGIQQDSLLLFAPVGIAPVVGLAALYVWPGGFFTAV